MTADAERLTLTPAEVAERIGTSEHWVRAQVRNPGPTTPPHLRLGRGKVTFLPEHVDALLARAARGDGEHIPPPADRPLVTELSRKRGQRRRQGGAA